MANRQYRALPTAKQLLEALTYDPSTGIFRWRWRDGVAEAANRCFTGKVAGRNCRHGYKQITLDGVPVMAHRAAWAVTYGEWPVHEIDHINGVPSDNRIANLRLATRAENTRNTKVRRDSSSGVKGVQPMRDTGRWVAAIRENGRRKHLGCFATIAEAQAAYQAASERLHGVFARTG